MIHKTGIIYASGDEIGENLLLDSDTFSTSEWTINTIFTSSQNREGETILSASNTGETSNQWRRIIPKTQFDYNNYPDGITVSFDFMCDDLAALDHKCICSLQVYNSSGTRVGWYESKNSFTEANYVGSTALEDGVWKRLSCHFTQANLKVVSSSSYTVSDVSYTTLSFNLVKNGSIHFKKIKAEAGTVATPWTMNKNDWGFVGNNHGFIERFNGEHPMSVYEGHYEMDEIIEY